MFALFITTAVNYVALSALMSKPKLGAGLLSRSFTSELVPMPAFKNNFSMFILKHETPYNVHLNTGILLFCKLLCLMWCNVGYMCVSPTYCVFRWCRHAASSAGIPVWPQWPFCPEERPRTGWILSAEERRLLHFHPPGSSAPPHPFATGSSENMNELESHGSGDAFFDGLLTRPTPAVHSLWNYKDSTI